MIINKKKISIITPCFNEELNLRECYKKVKEIFNTKLKKYNREHIFCDNDSTDTTQKILRSIAAKDQCVKIIINSRNFGILKNTFNGVIHASGDAVLLFLPADMQDPPELLPSFIKKWEEGYEVVYGIRSQRQEGVILRAARKIYYKILSTISLVPYPPNVGDFQLIDKKVIQSLKSFNDAQPFLRIMTFECGYKSVGIKYTWKKRKYGFSKNSLFNLFDQGINGLTAFTNIPVRLALFSGFIISFLAIIYSSAIVILYFANAVEAPKGILTIIAAIFFFGGAQLLFIGILGEYILAIFNQVRKKPLVIERERINF